MVWCLITWLLIHLFFSIFALISRLSPNHYFPFITTVSRNEYSIFQNEFLMVVIKVSFLGHIFIICVTFLSPGSCWRLSSSFLQWSSPSKPGKIKEWTYTPTRRDSSTTSQSFDVDGIEPYFSTVSGRHKAFTIFPLYHIDKHLHHIIFLFKDLFF